jgi:hypothetical protein
MNIENSVLIQLNGNTFYDWIYTTLTYQLKKKSLDIFESIELNVLRPNCSFALAVTLKII